MTKFDELCAKLKEIFELDKPELLAGVQKWKVWGEQKWNR